MNAVPWGIWHWLERHADISGEKPALIDRERVVTYRALRDRVAAVAGGLRDRGVERGDRVAVLSVNRAEYVEVLFAAAWLGAIVVPLNWRLAAPEVAFQIGDSGPKVLVVDPALSSLTQTVGARPEVESVRTWVCFDGDGPPVTWAEPYAALQQGGGTSPAAGSFDDPLLIMYTSGTTGRPKGAVLNQATQFWNSVNIGTAVALTSADVTLNVLPMFHTGGIGLFTLPSLHHGATAVLQRVFDPDETTRLLARHGVTAMFGVPAIYLALLASESFRGSDLRRTRFSCGGAPCPLTIIEAFRDRGLLFQQGYGLTETAPTCLLIPAVDAFRKAGSAGKAAIHVEARVVGDHGQDVPPGATGEIWTRGPNVFSGYWRRPDATAEAFTDDGWFKTGDLARIDADGFIFIVDRKGDMIISGGENVYPAEIEDVLYRHPAIADVAVIGIPHERWGETPRAIVVLKPGARLTVEEVVAFCDGRLARYKIPRSVTFVDTLPRNAAGKVLKRLLREQVRA